MFLIEFEYCNGSQDPLSVKNSLTVAKSSGLSENIKLALDFSFSTENLNPFTFRKAVRYKSDVKYFFSCSIFIFF